MGVLCHATTAGSLLRFSGSLSRLSRAGPLSVFFFSVVQVRHTNATLARDDRRFPSPRYRIAFLNFPGDPSMRLSCSSSPCRPCFRNPYFFFFAFLAPFRTRTQKTNVGCHTLFWRQGIKGDELVRLHTKKGRGVRRPTTRTCFFFFVEKRVQE